MKVRVKKIHKDAKIPSYAHQGDSGMDLYSVEEATIEPGERKMVGTGLQISLPKGFNIISLPNLILSNSPFNPLMQTILLE